MAFNINLIPRAHNSDANLLANVASKLIPSEEFSHDKFSIEVLFRTYVHDNIINWRIFNEDCDIYFFTQEDTYHASVIDEDQHNLEFNSPSSDIKK
jgi:hypothetical protein